VNGNEVTITIDGYTITNDDTIEVEVGNQRADSVTVSGTNQVTGTWTRGFLGGTRRARVTADRGTGAARRRLSTTSSEIVTSLNPTLSAPPICSWAGGCDLNLASAGLTASAEAGDISVEV
jgi:hypothetical protein